MGGKYKIESTSLLAVEGKDECNFFKALLSHMLIRNIQLVDIGGKDKFPVEFQILYNLENFRTVNRLGFIRDAESNPADSAFSSICTILKKHHLPVPKRPNSVETGSGLHTGIFIMPDNTKTGMLESLCLETIQEHPVNRCIETFLDCFSMHQLDSEKQFFNIPKAKVQAYLSTRSPIVNSLGLGALNGYWNFDHSCFYEIKSFLKLLFFS